MEKCISEMNAYVKRQALYELKDKLAPGVLGHVGVNLILLFFTPLLSDHLWPISLLSAGVILSSLVRIPLGRASWAKIDENPSAWKLKVYLSLYATLICWSAIFIYTLLHYPLSTLSVFFVALIAAGNTANATTALHSDLKLARIFVIVFMASLIFGLLLPNTHDGFAVALLSLIHLFYHLIQTDLLSRGFRQDKEREFNLKILEEEREQSRILLWGVLNGLADAVFLKGTDNTVQLVNRAGEQLIGVDAETLIGRDLDDFIPESIAEALRSIDETILATDQPFYDQLSLAGGDDEEIHISRSFFPYHDAKGKVIGILCVSRDISTLKNHERSILQARDELERRVDERTHDLSVLSESLIVSQERLGSVLTNAPIILWAMDKGGAITHCEGAGLYSIGMQAAELIGKSIGDVFLSPSLQAEVMKTLQGESFSSENLFGGTWFESHWSCLRDMDGATAGAACLSLDITERKKSEAATSESSRLHEIVRTQKRISNARLDAQQIMDIVCEQARSMIHSDAMAVDLLDGESIVNRASAGVTVRPLGFRMPIAGTFTAHVIAGREKKLCNDILLDPQVNQDLARRFNVRSIIMVPICHSNQVFGVLTAFSHLPDAFIESQMGALELMAELLAAALSQAAEFEEKKKAIATLQSTEKNLIKARHQAEAAAQTKADFLASMSHEIRTPLNGIIGMTELLVDSQLSEEQLRFARVVQSSGNGLLAIINDILDFSKIDAGKLELEESSFDSVLLVESQAELLAMKAKEKRLSLMTFIDPAIPHYLVGDAGRIGQILLNLLGNAIKFTQMGGVSIKARLLHLADDEATVRWEVWDTGIGISKETQEKLFTPFTQADGSTARKYGGTGLGLSISKRLVDLMGGKIGIDSVEGKGAIFWFTLTLRRGADAALPMAELDLSNSRILVVDDDPFACEVIRSYLHGWKADALAVESGEKALEVLRQATLDGNPFQLVLIDRRMESMDGFELARHIKTDEVTNPCKLILITAFDGPGQSRAATDAKFNAFLTKPVRKMELRHTVGSLLKLNFSFESTHEESRSSKLRGDERVGNSRILVVEDNSVNQLLAIQQLKKVGLVCQVAGNGREALEALEHNEFDLILMDCQMPEMDGYEATLRIRQIEKGTGRRVPIIAMTANAMREDEERCWASGMDDFLAKPIKQDKLEAKLKLWLPEIKQTA